MTGPEMVQQIKVKCKIIAAAVDLIPQARDEDDLRQDDLDYLEDQAAQLADLVENLVAACLAE